MAEERSGEVDGGVTEACFFGRSRSTVDGYDSIHLRVPSLGMCAVDPGAKYTGTPSLVQGSDYVLYTGTEAQRNIIRFYLGSAVGALRESGLVELAEQVEAALPVVMERIDVGA